VSDDKKLDPSSEKLAALFGGGNIEPNAIEPSDREWVEDQLEPVAGDRVIGTLSEEEVERFVSMTMIDLELEGLQQMLRNRLEEAQIKFTHRAGGNWTEYMRLMQSHSLYNDEAEAEETFHVYHESAYQQSAFWRDIRAKHDVWGDTLAIRHGWTIVSLGKKYKAP
jgi:hypothetical protein